MYMKTKKIRVNLISESEISVQGHGVHTAYEEMVRALEKRSDVEVITGRFGQRIDCDVVHLHTVGPRTWHKLFQKGVKKVVSAHVVPASFVGSLILARYWLPIARLYLRWFYNRADLVIAVSETTKHELEEMGVKKPIRVLYNSIDSVPYRTGEGRTEIRKKLQISDAAFLVIGAGQTQPRKRLDTFLAVAATLSDVEFVWVGGMPFGALAADHAEIAKIMQRPPKNVHFPGIVSLEDMPKWYAASDAFLFPSDQETFGLVVVEAAASKLPVILRDIHDYDDTFRDGALMAASDKEFIEAVRRLKDDRGFYDQAVEKSQILAERFDSAASAEQLVEFYWALIDGIIEI